MRKLVCIVSFVLACVACAVNDAPKPITLLGAAQIGAGDGVTQALVLSFDTDPAGLSAERISVTGAIKGTLSGSGTTRTLTLAGITDFGEVVLTVSLTAIPGYVIQGAPVNVTVYNLAIGTSYQGGKIAYFKKPADSGYDERIPHGLIVSPADQDAGCFRVWALAGYTNIAVPGGTGTALGSGSENTANIIAQQGSSTTYAAGLAKSYDGGGYTDWYMPSIDEMVLISQNRDQFGGLSADSYWTSSEQDGANIWYYFPSSDYKGYDTKDKPGRVRAIRSF